MVVVAARVAGGAAAGVGVEEVLGGREQVVCLGVEALRDELLLDARVPEVLDLVVRAPRQVLGERSPKIKRAPTKTVVSALM